MSVADCVGLGGWDKRVGKPVLLYARCGGKGEPTFLSVAGCLGLGGWDKRVGKPVLLYSRVVVKENGLSCPSRVVWGALDGINGLENPFSFMLGLWERRTDFLVRCALYGVRWMG